jgi:hypothetical protein
MQPQARNVQHQLPATVLQPVSDTSDAGAAAAAVADAADVAVAVADAGVADAAVL